MMTELSQSSAANPSPRLHAAVRRRRTLSLFGALGLLASVGLGDARGDAGKPAAGKPLKPQAPAPANLPAATPATKAPRNALLNAAEEITRQVATLRGLPSKTPFQRGVLSRAEIGQKLRERISKDYSPDEVRVESAVLKRMGLLALDADYEKLLFDLLTEQVAGFYDPYAKTLYIADWLALEMQRPALAHEIQHALQDQYFDLKEFSKPLKEEGDRQLARSAVVEGDGTAVMLEYTARAMGLGMVKLPEMVAHLGKQMMEMSMGATPAFQKAPAVLRETLVFPYAVGLEFIAALRGDQPWQRIDEVFRDPPESTEQVMHPNKYLQRERPIRITPAPLSTLAPRREVRRDVLGEMEMKVWFASRLPEAQAAQAAAGWGGDRMVAYEQDGDALPAVVVLSAWDSDRDTDDAEQAARKIVLGLAGPAPLGQKEKDAAPVTPARGGRGGSSRFVRDSGGLAFSVTRRGRQVLILCGVPMAGESAIADEVFRTWQVEAPSAAAPTSTTPAPSAPKAPAPPK